jgi:hypothetical protein
VVRQPPRLFGHDATRWTLKRLRASVEWLAVSADSSLSRVLRRLGISYKRGRAQLHSPDLAYAAKVAQIESYQQRMEADPAAYPLLYLDEVTFYRQPTLAQAYEAQGSTQPAAPLSHKSNTKGRVLAALDAHSGQVHYRQRSTITLTVLRDFWYQLVESYPAASEIAVVLDNWPVHFHPDVLAPLQAQDFPFPVPQPASWPTAPSPKAQHDTLPLQLVQLPTYAPWLNPIEKLWRFLYQEVLHLHRLSDQWQRLKQRVCAFLDRFADGSNRLLRYVGLLRA